MEASEGKGFFEFWSSNLHMVAWCILLFSAILIAYIPQFIVQRRLPKLTLEDVMAQWPNLGWLGWGSIVWVMGTFLLVAAGIDYCVARSHRIANDESSGFLIIPVLCIVPLSAGVFALWTGVYRGLHRRWLFTNEYYCVADTPHRRLPWVQIVAALVIAGLSLVGFLAMGGR
jgi:hypothetical protein